MLCRMIESGWLLRYVRAEVPQPAVPLPGVAELPGGWSEWLAEEDIRVGTPYLISPTFEYDVELNAFFRSAVMVGRAWTTQVGYAGDVKAFLNFLWRARGGRSWRDATEADHLAYLVWRRRDAGGPRVDDATWDREVTAVNRFYAWQVRAGYVRVNPIPQRERRPVPVSGGGRVGVVEGEAPATLSHGAGRDKIEWFPPVSYRRWRDVGVRGYTVESRPDPGFRGRWAARNATFCDLMVRTGMRLSEQTAVTLFEVPLGRGRGGYQRFWLPAAIAKGGSARWVYVPSSVAADVADYVEFDRAEVVAQARADGRYRRWRRPLVVEDPACPVVRTAGGHRTKVSLLDPVERRQLLVDGPDGLEPAMLWLSEFGTPMATSTWKDMFGTANRRCRSRGVRLHGHAHLLRHSYAVITLEQMQRGHIAALAEMTPGQRESYVRIFGDPLNWVRCRLGHASVVTTQIYLHALAELEMETRMALVPDGWDDPRAFPPDFVPDDTGAPADPAA
jgi:site-specific recombinase XerD